MRDSAKYRDLKSYTLESHAYFMLSQDTDYAWVYLSLNVVYPNPIYSFFAHDYMRLRRKTYYLCPLRL